MQDSTLLKAAVLCSLVGIAVIFLMGEKIQPKMSSIDKMQERDYIKAEGIITNLMAKPTLTIFDLQQGEKKIKVVSFEAVKIKNGMLIEVEGTVTEYKGSLEINAEAIRSIQ